MNPAELLLLAVVATHSCAFCNSTRLVALFAVPVADN